ncbi:MAG TPA: 1-phosphofructokinase [Roseiflexaceae bacterium]|nr:1-phosphofructokinase [Roseiflexaceae bacterium]
MIYTVTLNPALDRELTIPALAFGDVLRATAARVDCGGKGFNVSRMLVALGAVNVALGFAGGHTGATLRDGLSELGVETDFVWIAGETRTNVSIVIAGDGRHIKVNEAGPSITSDEQAALIDRVRQRARRDDWWVLAGSLPPGAAPTLYAELIRDIQSAGARVVLDTSGAALRHGCAAQPFLVKPNAAEASELTGQPVATIDQALAAARAMQGISHVVISMGAAGALLVHAGRGWLATPPTIRERNPIGAGDSLVAGLTWGLSQGYALPEAIRWGVACGADAASRSGTAVGTYDDIARLAEQVAVRAVS